jgi:IS30 family transposase
MFFNPSGTLLLCHKSKYSTAYWYIIALPFSVVDEKQRIGDWECDTMVGKDRKSVLVTVVDRFTLTTCCSRVYNRSALVVSRAIIRMLKLAHG